MVDCFHGSASSGAYDSVFRLSKRQCHSLRHQLVRQAAVPLPRLQTRFRGTTAKSPRSGSRQRSRVRSAGSGNVSGACLDARRGSSVQDQPQHTRCPAQKKSKRCLTCQKPCCPCKKVTCWNSTSCGHLCVARIRNAGFGSLYAAAPAKLSLLPSETEAR